MWREEENGEEDEKGDISEVDSLDRRKRISTASYRINNSINK
jgi:hypothetical protein